MVVNCSLEVFVLVPWKCFNQCRLLFIKEIKKKKNLNHVTKQGLSNCSKHLEWVNVLAAAISVLQSVLNALV